MTRQETNQLLLLLKVNYSYAFKGMTREEKYLLLNSWALALCDIDANLVMTAVVRLIAKSKWMPTVAEIREACGEVYYDAAFELEQLERMTEWKLLNDPNRMKTLKYLSSAASPLRDYRADSKSSAPTLFMLTERTKIRGAENEPTAFFAEDGQEYADMREDEG